jgi:predicted small lipoprotein YifL
MKRLTFLFSALAFMSLLSGCGQSGPLYIPGDPSTITVSAAGASSGEDAPSEEQESSGEDALSEEQESSDSKDAE